MLLVHGRTWSTRPDFDLQVPGESLSLMDGLVAMGVAAYGVDLRGYGATPRDASGWLTPERAVADVAGVLRWVGARHPELPAPYLFGWSYGAMVGQLTVQFHGDLVGGLILFGYPVRPGFDQDPAELLMPLRAPTTEAQARSDFLLPGSISERAMDGFVASALAHDPVRMDWRELGQWRALDGARVRLPTLLLQAEHDPLALPEVHARLFAALNTPDKVWAVIPGGDHAAFMETPRGYFLRLIETFVFR
jgi:pimeloyl-ACP methyl ester carboxylesterase